MHKPNATYALQDDFFKAQSSAGKLPTYVELLRFSVRTHCLCPVAMVPCPAPCTGCSCSFCDTSNVIPLASIFDASVQNLAVGSKVWGAVQEVTQKRLVVSLPHGLRGFVVPEDASDVLRSLLAPEPTKADKRLKALLHGNVPSLTNMFYPGQFVRCVVSRLDDGAGKGEAQPPKAAKVRLHTMEVARAQVVVLLSTL
jgi:hypothetical protein